MSRLPSFPVDDTTLDLLWSAIHPWETDPDAPRSSLGDFLTMMDRLGGSDPDAVAEEVDGVKVMRDRCYTEHDVITALITEVRALRLAKETP